MTFAQLRSFATVARLGSVTASARELGVSAPAVSRAIAALRRELGDQLLVPYERGVRLTPGGSRLAATASEILALAEDARRAVEEASGESLRVRVAVTSDVAEYVAAPLADAFTGRAQPAEVSIRVASPASFAALLRDRAVDVTLGPQTEHAGDLDAVAFLRYRLIVVAAPGHPLAGRRQIPAAALAGERWLAGASDAGPDTPVGSVLAAHGLAPDDVRAAPSHAAAVIAAEAGRGVMLAVAHTVLDELRRATLVRLDVRGTPLDELWYATALGPAHRSAAAAALLRFIVTAEATQAILSRNGEVPAGRFRSPVYVTLWHA